MIRFKTVFTGLLLILLIPLSQIAAAETIEEVISAAIADPSRPDSDKAQDANRKSLEVLTFAGIKPGDRVADFIPGRGYVTRLFAKIVGKDGHVYAVVPDELRANADKPVRLIANEPGYSNVSVVRDPVNRFADLKNLDMVWTSMNYHDLHDSFFGPANLADVNKSIYKALKPGGIYLVLDHTAAAGSGLRDTDTLHRIDPAVVKKEVLAAGFELVGESDVLHNPADDHTLKVFDPSVRGRTDKFVFKFRKPLHAM